MMVAASYHKPKSKSSSHKSFDGSSGYKGYKGKKSGKKGKSHKSKHFEKNINCAIHTLMLILKLTNKPSSVHDGVLGKDIGIEPTKSRFESPCFHSFYVSLLKIFLFR